MSTLPDFRPPPTLVTDPLVPLLAAEMLTFIRSLPTSPNPLIDSWWNDEGVPTFSRFINNVPSVDGYWQFGDIDDTQSFVRGFAANYRLYGTAGKIYTISNVLLDGKQFHGRGCVIRDAVGADYCFRLQGFDPELVDVQFQDMGNIAYETTNVGGFAFNATTITVANPAGFKTGKMVLVQGNGNLWSQTLISNVVGNVVTLRDAVSETGTAGLKIVASFGQVHLYDSQHANIEDLLFNNTTFGLVMSNSGPSASTGIAHIVKLDFGGVKYCAVAKYDNCHDVQMDDFIAFCGLNSPFDYIGNNVAGSFGVGYRVDLFRDVTVTVGGVLKTYLVDYTYLDAFTITFLAGKFPAVGALIHIDHYHCGVRGFIEDQRHAVVSGGSCFSRFKILKCFIGMELQSDIGTLFLSDYNNIILDTNQFIGLFVNNIGFDLNFQQLSSTFTRQCIVALNCNLPAFHNVTTTLIPGSVVNAFSPVNGPEIYADATSIIDVNLDQWSSPGYTTGQPGQINLFGGRRQVFGSSTAVAAGATVYLGPSGQIPIGLPIDILDKDCFLVQMWAAINIAPGVGQSVTFTLIENSNQAAPTIVASLVIADNGFGGFWAGTPVAMSKLQSISMKVVYSAGAVASIPRGYFLRR